MLVQASGIDVGFDVLKTNAMAESNKDDKKPFAFWLVQCFYPHVEQPDSHEPMSSFQFALSLAGGLVLILVNGILIRGCSI
jgi:hypothetical protein